MCEILSYKMISVRCETQKLVARSEAPTPKKMWPLGTEIQSHATSFSRLLSQDVSAALTTP